MSRKFDYFDEEDFRSNRDAFRDRKEAKEQKQHRRKLPKNPSYFEEEPLEEED